MFMVTKNVGQVVNLRPVVGYPLGGPGRVSHNARGRLTTGRRMPSCPTFALALSLVTMAAAQPRTVTDAEVMRVHRSTLLIDTHNDVTSRTVEGFDIGPRAPNGHTDIVRLKEGGVGAQFFAVYVAASYVDGNHSGNRALQMIDTVRHDIVGKYPN